MQKSRRCGDPDVRAIMEAGTESVEWVRQEFARADLSDKRLDRRLVKTAEYLAQSPGSPINEACGNWASTQAAYRLFNNAKASAAGILKPHWEATAARMAGCGGAVLVMQDTVFFSYGRHVRTRGLGPIGKSNAAHDRGLIMHNALAFTTSGVPLGIVSQSIWARGEIPEEDYQEKIERLQVTAIEEKESAKWLIALKETVERAPAGVPVVTVADRESDFFEFLTRAQDLQAHYLIRARTDRKLVPEDSAGCTRMLEALSDAPAWGSMTIEVPGNGSRKARTAAIEVRTAEVTIQPPPRRGAAQTSGSSEPVTVTLIGATESSPPAGVEPISWVLLTNLIVKDFASATEKVRWYGRRWGIEIWHKVLKSGCKVEDCLLEEALRLKRYLTLFSIIGVRLMHVTYLARAHPDRPATEVFSEEEVEALHIRVTRALPPAGPAPTLRDMVRMLGRLGGHLGRKGDGEPGVTVLWRGWTSLYETVETLRAHKHVLSPRDSS
ncbi:IS4 family transposase [Acidiferrobacter thiooxydans]|uniref:Transposase n=1 Tax=Acidiferrobacter thiooxydans TaxID=163359 RepID=A0A368HD34_9GAMM|nr:IS4 family transposase [Acidiferrobacter thiooxydans]RCN55840.1 transposase [Acidiferrobacter thiooxydans]RCN55885.1 transposase [Acidiferrobacter thiooxydans]RCN56278.1 transposase [Acidiferrobacter thiooxydans]RCN56705.1 transposase [Acidiferrobacter thiooxydans]RCN59097.1 transposase [Acidiferrobacter thiooxydans]